MTVPINPDLPLSQVRPQTAVFMDFSAPAGGDDSEPINVLLFGERLTTGLWAPNSVNPILSQKDCDDGAGSRSVLALIARSALATGKGGNVRLWGVPVAENSGGTAATMKIVCSGTATAAGGANILFGSQIVSVSWASGDAAATVAATLLAALQALDRQPWTFALSTATITATGNIKGAVLNDWPIRVSYTVQGTGIFFGPGSLTLATNAGADGTVKVINGTTTISTAVTSGDTPTTMAAAVVAAINADDYPIDAGTNTAGALPLYFAHNRVCRRTSASVVTTTGTTATITGGSATDGTGSASSFTYAGVLGAGFPTLATALTNVHNAGSFGKWVCPWADTTPLGSLFGQVVTDAGGGSGAQRGQVLHVGSVDGLATAGALASGTSPAMTTSLQGQTRGAVIWCPDSAVSGWDQAARTAMMRASVASPFHVYNGEALPYTADVPVYTPDRAVQPSDSTINSALRDYGLTPLVVKGGALVIEQGRTTSLSSDRKPWDWSYVDQRDSHRRDVRTQGPARFRNCALVASVASVQTQYDVTTDVVKAWLRGKLVEWESEGTYDGAAALAPQVAAAINSGQASRCDATYPDSPKIPFHILSLISQQASPPIGG